jgi:hypothetical protein
MGRTEPAGGAQLAGLGLVEALGALWLVAPLALCGNFRHRVRRLRYLDE